MKSLVFLLLFLATPALAQQPIVLPKELTVTLTAEQFNYIYALLNDRPYKEVADMLATLRAQATQQAKPSPVAEKKD